MKKDKSLCTVVRNWNGAPTLFINGQPDTGLMLYHNNVECGHDEMADFALAGIDLLTTGVGSTSALRPDGTVDTRDIDAKMSVILAANPRALVLTRLSLSPPAWWVKQHPDQMMVHRDPNLGREVESEYKPVSFASELWRAEMGAAMRQIIRYCETAYGDHFLGYHLCAGECGEWAYAWRNYTQSDYSEAQRQAFRRWTGDSTAEIPEDWRIPSGGSGILDPEGDAALIRYMRFHSDVVADALLQFARLAKEELRAVEREKIVAVFYGYHFTPPGNPSAFFNSGHHALGRVLESPDVDVLCAPYSYFQREAGGTYYSQLVPGSVRLHGKLLYSEEDTVTHVVPPVPYRYHCPDEWTTEQVLRRNVLGSLRDGGTSWYMDWFGQNWYRDQALMASIAATQRLAQERLQFDNASVAQIAVIVDEAVIQCLHHHETLINRWTLERLTELWRLGAPVDVFLSSDLSLLDASLYRLIVRLDREPERMGVAAWRQAAVAAGVHLYSEVGDQVLAERQLLTVHAGSAGDRVIRLPRPRTVTDALTGIQVAAGVSEFRVRMKLGETAVWKLA